MLQPKKVRYTKIFNKKIKGKASKAHTVDFGDFGLKSMENAYLSANQIEAFRMAISKYIKRKGKVWIRVFPDMPVTKKPSARMGGGKSAIDHWAAKVKKGRVIAEIGGVQEDVSRKAFRVAANKLPIKVKIVEKRY